MKKTGTARAKRYHVSRTIENLQSVAWKYAYPYVDDGHGESEDLVIDMRLPIASAH